MTRKAPPQVARQAALAIVRTLRGAEHAAYFAGGCVRDELLGLAPTDYDVATDATPDRISGLFRRTNEVGAAFGVVLVTLGPQEGLASQATVEVATFRSEGPYSDRRRPDRVSFSDPRADALRRDFTVNALFLDPEGDSSLPDSVAGAKLVPHPLAGGGRIIDLVGGVDDLERRVLRAVGDPEARLAEDHLRALRAVRFAARLGFAIDPATSAAIRRHTLDLMGVSRERIGDELRRIMGHPSRAAAVGLLQELGLDAPVLEEESKKSPAVTLAGLPGGPMPTLSTCLAAWALDRGLDALRGPVRETTSRWRRALCLSNDESAGLRATLDSYALLLSSWLGAETAAQKRAVTPAFHEALSLLQVVDPARAARVEARLAELRATPSGVSPEPLVTGDDLVAAGFRPGPAFKGLLDGVYDAQLEDRIKTREEGMELARALARQTG